MNIITEIYKQVRNQLLAEVPAIRFIDFDNGQLDYYVSYPCALIDISDIAYNDSGDQDNWAACEVTIKLAFEVYENTNSLTPNDNALDHADTVTATLNALRGFEFDNSDTFTRRRLSRIPAQGLKVYSAVFNVSVFGDC